MPAPANPSSQRAIADADAALKSGDAAGAEKILRALLRAEPSSVAALQRLGVACHRQGRLDDALAAFERVRDLAPQSPAAHVNLGGLLGALGRDEDALACVDRALALDPDSGQALILRADLSGRLGRLDGAIADLRRATELEPASATAFNNLGAALCRVNRHEDAVACYRRALALNADPRRAPEGHLNLAFALLALGDYAEGWREYEWRLRAPGRSGPDRAVPGARWTGAEDLAGRTLLVLAEQGLGDAMQFVRYVPMLARRGATVVLEVRPPLERLMRGLDGVARIVTAESLPRDADYHVEMLSLPGLFGTTPSTVPAEVPYLRPDRAAVEKWSGALAGDGLRVGLAWSGNPDHPDDRPRSMALDRLAPLLDDAGGIRFVSLQKEIGADDAALLGRWPHLSRFDAELEDFCDTAALVARLDLVIAVDTAVAHLAGALARPLWLLLPHAAEWRWLRGRADSPWYPTARLFRQPAPGDWPSVVGAVRRALTGLLRG